VPGARIAVVASEPFDGPLSLDIGGGLHPLDRRIAREIYVKRDPLDS
jgi:Fe2+ transport system protein FeoA